jgi:hypothetical protein
MGHYTVNVVDSSTRANHSAIFYFLALRQVSAITRLRSSRSPTRYYQFTSSPVLINSMLKPLWVTCSVAPTLPVIHSLTLTHSWNWALLEKLPIVQLLKNFPAFYGTRTFITVFTRALHWSLSWARSIQSIPYHPIPSYLSKNHFNIVHLPMPWSSQWSLSFWLSQQYPICISLLPHSCYMPCSSHPPWLHHSNYTWRRVQVMKPLIM